ncbi:MAG: Holliday junction resolvase RuvX [Verrucomicrobia bacterium]|nr:Holliday junction resolvase RuvX [Verrucomicrobiota bacterium]MBM3871154.1 Holliday junction resolvase RuvX [Verrucomicrobiota bacterium]
MRTLALDHGTVRIGVAASDELGMIARPLEFIPAEPWEDFLQRFKQLLAELQPELIVVGLPRNMDGSLGPAAEKVREFVVKLRAVITVPLRTWDERLTSVQAQRMLREAGHKAKDQKGKVDATAAAVLLQSYLDSQSG